MSWCRSIRALTAALSLPSGSVPPVLAVKAEIEQVLLNAIRTRARHSIRWDVAWDLPISASTAQERNDRVLVTVTDQGAGIGADQLRTLFQPLKTTKAGGLGIGLYESRRLIEANNGRLLVESEAGHRDSGPDRAGGGRVFAGARFRRAGSKGVLNGRARCRRYGRRWVLPVAVLLLLSPACRWTKEGRKARHLAQAEGYSKQDKFKEAVIEYKNVLKVDGKNAGAIRHLGIALYEAGAPGEAAGYLQRAYDADPSDLEVRQRLATVFLLRGVPANAREHATFVLAKQPANLQALTVLGQSSETQEQLDDVIRRLEGEATSIGAPDKVNLLLGSLYLRKRDVARAEQAFVAAVDAKPDSAEPHLALAQLYARNNDLTRAEAEFRAAARLSLPSAVAQLQLAEFYIAVSRPEDARKVLVEADAEGSRSTCGMGHARGAEFREGKLDDAVKFLEPALKDSPDPAALLLRTRIHLAKHETTQAIEAANKAVGTRPGLAAAHHLLALAHVQSGNAALALAQAKEALRLAPGFPEAALLVAELEMQSSAPQNAVQVLTTFVGQNPRVPPAYELLGKAYLGTKDPVRATEAFRAGAELIAEGFTRHLPGRRRSPGPGQDGGGAQAVREGAGARTRIDRGARPARIDELPGQEAASRDRKDPSTGGRGTEVGGDPVPAGSRLPIPAGRHRGGSGVPQGSRTAAQPDGGVRRPGPIYGASRQFDRALHNFEKAAALSPGQPVPQMLLAITRQQTGDVTRARAGYEKIVAAHPKFAPAANNLAWLLGEEGEVQKARSLAQRARDLASDDPHIADTLGWMLYKQSALPARARAAQGKRDEAGRQPRGAVPPGDGQPQAGTCGGGQEALTKAVALSTAFPGAEDAKAVLATLK